MKHFREQFNPFNELYVITELSGDNNNLNHGIVGIATSLEEYNIVIFFLPVLPIGACHLNWRL